jgi:hypothetical protein
MSTNRCITLNLCHITSKTLIATMFGIMDLQTMLMSVSYLGAKVHMPCFSDPLVTAIKQKTYEYFSTVAIFFFYIVQDSYLKKRLQFLVIYYSTSCQNPNTFLSGATLASTSQVHSSSMLSLLKVRCVEWGGVVLNDTCSHQTSWKFIKFRRKTFRLKIVVIRSWKSQ